MNPRKTLERFYEILRDYEDDIREEMENEKCPVIRSCLNKKLNELIDDLKDYEVSEGLCRHLYGEEKHDGEWYCSECGELIPHDDNYGE